MIYRFQASHECGHTHVNTAQIVRVSASGRKPAGLYQLTMTDGFVDGVSEADMQNIEAMSTALADAAAVWLDEKAGRS